MSFAEKLQIAGLLVAIVAAIAALLQPSVRRVNRVLATLVLVGVVAWLGITIVTSGTEPPPRTDTGNTMDTAATTSSVKTITYPAPPEPTTTSDTDRTTVTLTTSTPFQIPSERTVTATTSTTSTQPKFEPPPPAPTPVAPRLDTTEIKKPQIPIRRPSFEEEVKNAIALSDKHEWQEAVDAWNRLIRINSGRNQAFDPGAYRRLATAYESLNDWNNAAEAYKQANLHDVRNNATSDLRHMGVCYIRLHRNSEAIAVYSKLLEINPGDTASQNLLKALQSHR